MIAPQFTCKSIKHQVSVLPHWFIPSLLPPHLVRTSNSDNSCQSSYEAADGKKQKTSMESFDNTSLMALICRHNIPLFFANINLSSEEQKYFLALIAHLFSLLLPNATVMTLYDIGCTLNRMLSLVSHYICLLDLTSLCLFQYNILSSDIIAQLQFTTTAMHAYGHEWAC